MSTATRSSDLPAEALDFIRQALTEDIRDGDHTTLACVPADRPGTARALIKEDGVLAGIDVALAVFEAVDADLEVEVRLRDGSDVRYGDVAFFVSGNRTSILTAERLVLNFMQRMSGIATKTRRFVDRVKHTDARLLDTRKTTPGLRYFEKWAVRIGGGHNHRMGLYDMIMIKDNHVDFAGGIPQAIDAVRAYLDRQGLDLRIEIETRSMAEVREVLDHGGVDRIMLDNYDLAALREAVALIGDAAETEASGGVTLDTVGPIAETGVDFISVGALTHSFGSLDISLKAMD